MQEVVNATIDYVLAQYCLAFALACLLGSFDFVFIAFHFLVFPLHFCSILFAKPLKQQAKLSYLAVMKQGK